MSNLSLERLLFNAANPTDGPLIGSYIIGADGTVINDTGSSLDVNVTNASLTVDATDFDIRSLNVATDGDHVYITDSTGANALDIDASGYITANINGTVTVDATDLDIRQLVHTGGTPDSVQIGDGTEILLVNADGSINVAFASDADDAALTKNPLHVGSVSADQASALSAISASGDAASLTSDLYRRVFINDAPNIAVASTAATVGTSAAVLVATELAGRTRVMIQNNGDKPIFVGPSGVTTASGLEVAKGATLSLEAGEAIALYAISTDAGQDVRVFELA
jgi:hypothetical protein